MFNIDDIHAEMGFTIQDTSAIQTESLVRFAAGIGYEAVFDTQDRLRSFRAPQFDKSGDGRVSVSTMITLHNQGPSEVLQELRQYSEFRSFRSLMNSSSVDANRMTAVLFAGTLKLVETIKGQGSRKEGLVIQSGMVKFVTPAVYFQHRRKLGIK